MWFYKCLLVWGFVLSGLVVVLVVVWWVSQVLWELVLWSELWVLLVFVILCDFDLGEYCLSWGGKSFVLLVVGSVWLLLWESEGGFFGVGWESVGCLQLCCQEQSLESFELVG